MYLEDPEFGHWKTKDNPSFLLSLDSLLFIYAPEHLVDTQDSWSSRAQSRTQTGLV